MAGSAVLVDTLKRELKARGITYAAVARALGMSEASVKRMFSGGTFTLPRLDRVCEIAGLEFSELARRSSPPAPALTRLSAEQEREFVEQPKLMLVALLALNHWSFERMVEKYDLTPAECTRLLARLDRLKFIELLPGNRIRLLVSRAFSWIPDGPIQRLFKEHFKDDFFRARFDGEDEILVLANGALSRASIAALHARLRKTAAEFSAMREEDAALPAGERRAITLLVAARPWAAEFLERYRRRRASSAARRAGSASIPG